MSILKTFSVLTGLLSLGIFFCVLALLHYQMIWPETLPIPEAILHFTSNTLFSEKETYTYVSLQMIQVVLMIAFFFTPLLVKVFNTIIKRVSKDEARLNLSTSLCALPFLVGGIIPLMMVGMTLNDFRSGTFSFLSGSLMILWLVFFYLGIVAISAKIYASEIEIPEEEQKINDPNSKNAMSKENLKTNLKTLFTNPSAIVSFGALKESLPLFFTKETRSVITIITIQALCIVAPIITALILYK